MKKILIISLLCLAAFGCAAGITETRRELSSRLIKGCKAREITISDNREHAWLALCRGMRFHCTDSPSAVCVHGSMQFQRDE